MQEGEEWGNRKRTVNELGSNMMKNWITASDIKQKRNGANQLKNFQNWKMNKNTLKFVNFALKWETSEDISGPNRKCEGIQSVIWVNYVCSVKMDKDQKRRFYFFFFFWKKSQLKQLFSFRILNCKKYLSCAKDEGFQFCVCNIAVMQTH